MGVSLWGFWIFFPWGKFGLTAPVQPTLQWNAVPPRVAAVLIACKGAESPGSGRNESNRCDWFTFSHCEAV